MKKVIIFAYYFPPAGGIAVQRFLKFSRFLPKFGWQPIVVTVKNGSYPFIDESLLKEIDPQTVVYRTATFEPFEIYNLLRGKKGKNMPTVTMGDTRGKSFLQKAAEYIRANFFIPDARVGWVNYAVKQAEGIMANEKIDAIITTGPPHSTHLIGLQLKKRFGVKWIADFRDPWTGIFYNKFLPRTAASTAKDKRLEDEVLKAADCVTVISSGMVEPFKQRAADIQVLYNSYDDKKFEIPPAEQVAEKGFLFTYTGNFLTSQNVPALWQAFAEIKDACPDFKILIIGRADDAVKESINKAGIGDLVVYKDYMPHAQVVKYMWQSGMLLFLLANVEESKLLMTGKVFEYLPTGTEMMGIGPTDGSAQEVMDITQREPMLFYTDKEGMKLRLLSAYNYWKQNGVARKNNNGLHLKFSATATTQQLAQLLNKITGN